MEELTAGSAPRPTPGPLAPTDLGRQGTLWSPHLGQVVVGGIDGRTEAEQQANCRLVQAAYNASDAAGRRLNMDPVDLAERLADGGLSDLVDALEYSLPRIHQHLATTSVLAKVAVAIAKVRRPR